MTNSMEDASVYLALLQQEILLALGCTEPVAVALCAATAARALTVPPWRVEIKASSYIIRNGMHVGLPCGQGLSGLPLAAAFGSLLQLPEDGMTLFAKVAPHHIPLAEAMVREGRVVIENAQTPHTIWIEAIVSGKNGQQATAVIQGSHTHVVRMTLGDQLLFTAPLLSDHGKDMPKLTVKGIFAFCTTADVADLALLEKVIEVNTAIAKEGLQQPYGLQVGRRLLYRPAYGSCSREREVVALTSAAADARMAGCPLPVMTNMGSGNQGVTASVPVIETARQLGASREALLRALALSELIAMDVKLYIGRLSALCGCSISAAIGAACGMTLLMGGGYEQIVYAIKTMVADVSGIVCDGAKPGCALKIATAVSAAQRAGALAMAGSPEDGHYGIVSKDVEVTLQNLALLGQQGMCGANDTVLSLMLEEQDRAQADF